MHPGGPRQSPSVLDYGLIDSDHLQNVTSFVIDENARFECGTDHALLSCELQFNSRSRVKWEYNDAVHYDFNSNTCFKSYQLTLNQNVSPVSLDEFQAYSTKDMLSYITDTIHTSAMSTFGLKKKRKRKGFTLPRPVIDAIIARNDLQEQIDETLLPQSSHGYIKMAKELDVLKRRVKDLVGEFRLKRRTRLRSVLLLSDPNRRRFWRFLKHQIKSAGSISALQKDGEMVFDQSGIEEVTLDHFQKVFEGKRQPAFPQGTDHPDLTNDEKESIKPSGAPPEINHDEFESRICSPYTISELKDLLKDLPRGKASGYDGLPNELLSNASDLFANYILVFLNKILEDGQVPEEMNVGKCMLISKVNIQHLSLNYEHMPLNVIMLGW